MALQVPDCGVLLGHLAFVEHLLFLQLLLGVDLDQSMLSPGLFQLILLGVLHFLDQALVLENLAFHGRDDVVLKAVGLLHLLIELGLLEGEEVTRSFAIFGLLGLIVCIFHLCDYSKLNK